MLRLSRTTQGPSDTVLKVEGQILADCVEILEQECRELMARDRRVVLDLREVNYLDTRAARVLRSLAGRVSIINCSPLLQDLLAEAS